MIYKMLPIKFAQVFKNVSVSDDISYGRNMKYSNILREFHTTTYLWKNGGSSKVMCKVVQEDPVASQFRSSKLETAVNIIVPDDGERFLACTGEMEFNKPMEVFDYSYYFPFIITSPRFNVAVEFEVNPSTTAVEI